MHDFGASGELKISSIVSLSCLLYSVSHSTSLFKWLDSQTVMPYSCRPAACPAGRRRDTHVGGATSHRCGHPWLGLQASVSLSPYPLIVAAVQPSGHRLCCLPLLPALLLAGAPSQREPEAPLLLPPLCSYAAPWLPLAGVATGDVAPCCPWCPLLAVPCARCKACHAPTR